jgi:hypothetical protein
MNTNQIPPGIISGINDKGTIFKYHGSEANYSNWYNQHFKTGYLKPWSIEQDGKQWSVGDETNRGKIEAFKFSGNGKWVAQFVNNSSQYVEGLTTPTVKDSGGEESEFQKFVRERKESGEEMYFNDEIDEPTPINPSEPEETFEEYYQRNLKEVEKESTEEQFQSLKLACNKVIDWFEDLSQDVNDGTPLFNNLKALSNYKSKTSNP